MRLGEAVRDAAARLERSGADTPDLDARLLAQKAFAMTSARLLVETAVEAPPDGLALLAALVGRRTAGEPVSRILGRREFWGLDFTLAPETLDPRPDTETVVEAALTLAGSRDRALTILDLGTGAGCILLALLSELPNARGVGVERAQGAADVARQNAETLGLSTQANFVVGDWAAALGGPFDLVVSNPPYISSADIVGLDREVRAHDPRLALDGGEDGLAAYRAILGDLPRLLACDGVAVLEIGAGQHDAVARLAEASGLAPLGAANDLSGSPRALMLEAASGVRRLHPGGRLL